MGDDVGETKDTWSKSSFRKLIGWKAIGRHLGRSERAVQLWEIERHLPIHRIPGARGHSVYGYVEELDAWMASGDSVPLASADVSQDLVRAIDVGRAVPLPRPPGILVLPLENHDLDKATSFGDGLCQQLIARLAAAQRSVRVLSWQTSKNSRHGLESLAAIASRLNVRYLIEGSIDYSDGLRHVDMRIIDAELDQLVLSDRFVSAPNGSSSFQEQVAEAVAVHFALIHEGALVEPICLVETQPAVLLDYLRAAHQFFVGRESAIEDTLGSLERALARDPGFMPALAMKGLALLYLASDSVDRDQFIERARTLSTICTASTAAHVTGAFLNAAIAFVCDADRPRAELHLANAMRWLPSSVPERGRLYERRSSFRPRPDAESTAKEISSEACEHADLFTNLLALISHVNRRDVARQSSLTRGVATEVPASQNARSTLSENGARFRSM